MAISKRRGGAAALIGATQQGAITSSWRFIYIVMVSACLELGWALLWNVSPKVLCNRGSFAHRMCVCCRISVDDVTLRTGSRRTLTLVTAFSNDYDELPLDRLGKPMSVFDRKSPRSRGTSLGVMEGKWRVSGV
jgi:hypothetical protein